MSKRNITATFVAAFLFSFALSGDSFAQRVDTGAKKATPAPPSATTPAPVTPPPATPETPPSPIAAESSDIASLKEEVASLKIRIAKVVDLGGNIDPALASWNQLLGVSSNLDKALAFEGYKLVGGELAPMSTEEKAAFAEKYLPQVLREQPAGHVQRMHRNLPGMPTTLEEIYHAYILPLLGFIALGWGVVRIFRRFRARRAQGPETGCLGLTIFFIGVIGLGFSAPFTFSAQAAKSSAVKVTSVSPDFMGQGRDGRDNAHPTVPATINCSPVCAKQKVNEVKFDKTGLSVDPASIELSKDRRSMKVKVKVEQNATPDFYRFTLVRESEPDLASGDVKVSVYTEEGATVLADAIERMARRPAADPVYRIELEARFRLAYQDDKLGVQKAREFIAKPTAQAAAEFLKLENRKLVDLAEKRAENLVTLQVATAKSEVKKDISIAINDANLVYNATHQPLAARIEELEKLPARVGAAEESIGELARAGVSTAELLGKMAARKEGGFMGMGRKPGLTREEQKRLNDEVREELHRVGAKYPRKAG